MLAIHHPGYEGFRRCAGAWRELETAQKSANFFHGYDWYAAFLAHLRPADENVGVVELRRRGRCVGMLPYHQGRVLRGGIAIQVLALPSNPHMVLADVVLAEDLDGDAWLRAVQRGLAKDGPDWQALLFTHVLEDSAAMRLARGVRAGAVVRRCGQSRYFDCTLPFEQLSERFAGQLRKNIKKGSKRLEQSGKVEFLCIPAGDERAQWAYDHFLRLEASGWKGQSGTGSAIALQDNLSGFYRHLILGASDGMCAEINLLCVDGEAIAGQFAIRCGSRRNVLKIAYDEQFEHASPGTVLMANTLERSCKDPAVQTLSLVTDTPWMNAWNASAASVYDIWIAKNAFSRVLARLAVRARELLTIMHPRAS